jgi:hypothetical protein
MAVNKFMDANGNIVTANNPRAVRALKKQGYTAVSSNTQPKKKVKAQNTTVAAKNREKRIQQNVAKAKTKAEAENFNEFAQRAGFVSNPNAVQRTYSPSSIFDTSGAEADRIWNSGARDRFEPTSMVNTQTPVQTNTSTTGRGVRNTELAAKNKKIVNEVIAKEVDNRNPGTRRKDNRELNQLTFNDYQKEMEILDWEKRQNYVQTRRGMRPPRQGILPAVPNTPNLIDIARNPDYATGQEDAPVVAPSVPIHPVTGLPIEAGGDKWPSYTDAPSGNTYNNKNFNWNNNTPGPTDGLSQQEIDGLYGRPSSPVQPKQEVDFSGISDWFSKNWGK